MINYWKFSRDPYFARRVADRLLASGMIVSDNKPDHLYQRTASSLSAQWQLESKTDADATALLKTYEKEIAAGAVDSRKMFTMIKKKLVQDRRLVLLSDPTLSDEDKLSHLAHLIQKGILTDPDLDLTGTPESLLHEIKKILTAEVEMEMEILKIVETRLSHSKHLEGSDEWNLLYKRTFDELMKKRGYRAA